MTNRPKRACNRWDDSRLDFIHCKANRPKRERESHPTDKISSRLCQPNFAKLSSMLHDFRNGDPKKLACNLPCLINTDADCEVSHHNGRSDELNEKPELVTINTEHFLHKFSDSTGVWRKR